VNTMYDLKREGIERSFGAPFRPLSESRWRMDEAPRTANVPPDANKRYLLRADRRAREAPGETVEVDLPKTALSLGRTNFRGERANMVNQRGKYEMSRDRRPASRFGIIGRTRAASGPLRDALIVRSIVLSAGIPMGLHRKKLE
jgi:hypothetical protein